MQSKGDAKCIDNSNFHILQYFFKQFSMDDNGTFHCLGCSSNLIKDLIQLKRIKAGRPYFEARGMN